MARAEKANIALQLSLPTLHRTEGILKCNLLVPRGVDEELLATARLEMRDLRARPRIFLASGSGAALQVQVRQYSTFILGQVYVRRLLMLT
jgi:hypothetical protein